MISYKMYLIYLNFKVIVEGCKIGCPSKKFYCTRYYMEACSGQNSRDKNDPEGSVSN